MSTRTCIVVKDSNSHQFFYKHSDGYPDGTLPILEEFMTFIKQDKIRNNVSQGSGWLILMGHDAYINKGYCGNLEDMRKEDYKDNGYSGWKVGAIELTNGLHWDIEYLYILDLEKCEIRWRPADIGQDDDSQDFENLPLHENWRVIKFDKDASGNVTISGDRKE